MLKMTKCITSFLFLAVAFCATWKNEAATNDYYTAAVFEHSRQGNASTDSPKDIINMNLAYYRRAAALAKAKRADIIIFPEYGIFPPTNREELRNYLESVPNPSEILINPCDERGTHLKKPILYNLSCIAKENNIVVVANAGDIQPCEGQVDCPSDGAFHFNTNLAFDRNGTLLSRYHKEHLFFEMGMDLAREQQDPTFKTDFGTFAMFICFDIAYKRITEVAHWPSVDAVLLPTMWIDPTPLMTSVQLWQSWSMGNNVTFMAANIQIPGEFAVGSGIFLGRDGPIAYTYNPDGTSKLIVANVPRSSLSILPNTSTTIVTLDSYQEYEGDGKDVPQECSRKVLGESKDIYTDYRCLEENTANYTFVKLNETNDHIEACHNGMCCSLNYSSNSIQEDFYLGVYNGTYNMFDRYFLCEENCLLIRCNAFGDKPCATFPMRSNTVFYDVQLTAKFTTRHVYPSVLNSGMRLVPVEKWTYKVHEGTPLAGSINYHSDSGGKLLKIGLNGRCYDRDSPYER